MGFIKQFRKTFRYFYYYAGLLKMRKVKNSSSAQALIDFIYHDCWELFRPGQVKEEVVDLAKVLQQRRPKCIVEIGTGRSGGMLFVYSRTADEGAKIISIDLPGGEFGDSYPKHKASIFKRMALKSQEIHLIRARSHDAATLDQVKSILNGQEIDFLFIDGDHTYDGVKQDFETYSQLVSDEGLIVLQDIVPCKHSDCHVEDYWKDIKKQFPHQEIVKSWDQRWAGLGLIEKKAMSSLV